MNENIDTTKPLIVHQSKFTLVVLLLFYFCFGLVFVYLPILTNHIQNQKNLLIVIGAFAILLFFFIKTCRQFFIKTPVLQLDNKGFFTRKTGNVSWNEINEITMFATSGLTYIVLVFKNGKKVNINPIGMRVPNEGVYAVANRAFAVFEIMQAYKKASGV